MTIAFWSSVRHSGVTVTLASVCVIWSELYGECMNVTANHLSNEGILSCLMGELKRERRERKEYCYRFGEPEYFRRLKMEQCHSRYLLNQKMCYFPMEGKEETDYFTGCGLEGVMKQVAPEELLLIDVAAGENKGAIQILNSADFQVHILPGEKEEIDHFFLSCEPDYAKSFFILPKGRNSTSGYSRKQFCKKYKIPMQQVSEIRHSDEFATAVWEGRLVPFLRAHMVCSEVTKKMKRGEEWIRSLTETAVLLHRFVGKGGAHECEGYEGALRGKLPSGQEERQFCCRCLSWPASEQEDTM